jgi:pimeloyl-ACP methyl ester carboxylesterase
MTVFADIHRPTATSDAPPVLLLHGGNVANWMWQPQVDTLDDRLVVTPDLPGFGSRVHEVWPGLPTVVDDLADRLAALRITTAVDVVGLSLGGLVALHLAARHPQVIRSMFITGATVKPPGLVVRATAKLQLLLWNAPWFWKAQAAAFRLPADSRSTYVEHGLSVSRATARRMFDDVTTGGVPQGLADFTAPLLAVVGEREPQSIRDSLHVIRDAAPHAEVRLAPGMHHIWSVEDVDLFNQTMRRWLDGQVHPQLLQA